VSNYADTGFLVSLFLEETTSATADAVLAGLPGPLFVTPLTVLEFRNALNLAIVRKRLLTGERDSVWQKFEEQRRDGVFEDRTVDMGELYRRAQVLSDRHTPIHAARSLDLLHVSAALELGAKVFLSFDERQRRVAQGEGLVVNPPLKDRRE
jgi:predicted nucleic acid-binding protein